MWVDNGQRTLRGLEGGERIGKIRRFSRVRAKINPSRSLRHDAEISELISMNNFDECYATFMNINMARFVYLSSFKCA